MAAALAKVEKPEVSSDHNAQPISLVECPVIVVLAEMQTRVMSPAVLVHRICAIFHALLARRQEQS